MKSIAIKSPTCDSSPWPKECLKDVIGVGLINHHGADTADFAGGEEADPAAPGAAAVAGGELGLVAAEKLPEAGVLHRDQVRGDLQIIEGFNWEGEVSGPLKVDPLDHPVAPDKDSDSIRGCSSDFPLFIILLLSAPTPTLLGE